jgi:hypothetical protein
LSNSTLTGISARPTTIFAEPEEHHMSIRDDDESTSGSVSATSFDPYATHKRRRRGVRVTYAAAVALGLAIGGGAIAGAATGSNTSTTQPSDHTEGSGEHGGFGGTPPAALGTVASVGTSTFTLTSRYGTKRTVNVSGTTTYLDPGVTTPSFTDVKVGDHVAVFGTDTNNTVAATTVAVGGAGGPADHAGGPDGPADHPGGSGGHSDGPGDLAGGPGGHSDGPAVHPGGFFGFGGTRPAVVGTVASVSTNAFTLTAPDGTKVTVDVSSSTSYSEFGKTSASIGDVTVGVHVVVFGTDANNTVTAIQVGIAGAAGTHGPGGPADSHGPDGAGHRAPSSSSGAVPSGSSTTSTGSSSGSTLA